MYRASCPGRVSLLGEHAVLGNAEAVVCAINQRLTVELVPLKGPDVRIQSALGHYEGLLGQLQMVPPFQFILATLLRYQKHFKQGFTLTVQSDFSDQVGLASSAAVVVATLAALNGWLKLAFSQKKLALEARHIVQQAQGGGSGADVAACVMGGMLAYRRQPFEAVPLKCDVPFTVMYSGHKTKTADVLQKVQQHFSKQVPVMRSILKAIGKCSRAGRVAIESGDWERLGHWMNVQQGLMAALGVSTPLLDQMIAELRAQPNILGAKISGAGLGDCVIALGAVPKGFISQYAAQGVRQIDLQQTGQGVVCERI